MKKPHNYWFKACLVSVQTKTDNRCREVLHWVLFCKYIATLPRRTSCRRLHFFHFFRFFRFLYSFHHFRFFRNPPETTRRRACKRFEYKSCTRWSHSQNAFGTAFLFRQQFEKDLIVFSVVVYFLFQTRQTLQQRTWINFEMQCMSFTIRYFLYLFENESLFLENSIMSDEWCDRFDHQTFLFYVNRTVCAWLDCENIFPIIYFEETIQRMSNHWQFRNLFHFHHAFESVHHVVRVRVRSQ